MAKLNVRWHKSHRMPKNATLAQRVRWHVAHAAHCTCREMPTGIATEVERRQAFSRKTTR